MSDSFTETTTTGWFSRIGSSIKGILVGIILVVIAFPVLFLNEGRAVKTKKDLDQGAKEFVHIEATKVDETNNGKLVHFTGEATAEGVREDEQLKVKSEGLVLKRTVEMYQWKEETSTKTQKKLGGKEEKTTTYSYSKHWKEGRADSSKFKQSSGHENPSLPIQSSSWVASPISVGAFRLPNDLVSSINAYSSLSLGGDLELPAQIAGRDIKKEGDTIYLAENPSNPNVGDVRITYSVVKPTTVSIVAKQNGDTLEAFTGDSGTTINMLQVGEHSGNAMFESAQKSNKFMTWILRAVGFAAMFFGFSLMFKPLSVVADVLPIAGSIVGVGTGIVAFLLAAPLSLITIAVAWIFYRPLIGIPLLIIAAIGIAFLIKKMVAQKKASA
ncbi:MAG: TMEM43 family protein [Akkermansiaceae bacterium]